MLTPACSSCQGARTTGGRRTWAEISRPAGANDAIGPILAITPLGAMQVYMCMHIVARVCTALGRKCCAVRIRAALVILAIVAAILGLAFGAQAKSAPQGAFLTEYAGSVDEVIHQVEANRLVALRYAKHFRMDPASVLLYFRNELSLATLDESASMKVYSIGESSHIADETREFKKGAKVFVDRRGVPILEFGTGNPLGTSIVPAKSPEQVTDESRPKSPGNGGNLVQGAKQGQPQQGQITLPEPQAGKPGTIPANTINPPVTMPTLTPTVIAETPPATDAGPVGAPPIISHSRDSSNWLLPAGLVGAAAALAGGTGASSTSNDPGDSRINSPLVPEPLSLMVMASGVAGLAGGFIMRKRRVR